MWRGEVEELASSAAGLLAFRIVNRADFEAIRDIPGKVIKGDIRLSAKKQTSPALVADGIVIENAAGAQLKLNISYNPQSGAKTFNVTVAGGGPICRLDVDGPAHRPAGRGHKHSLQTERCPDANLPDGVADRPDLLGKPISELFEIFCEMAKIDHEGTFYPPSM